MKTIYRVMLTAGLLAISGFCIYGFLASYESPDFLVWRVGYGIAGLLSAATAVGITFFGRSVPDH